MRFSTLLMIVVGVASTVLLACNDDSRARSNSDAGNEDVGADIGSSADATDDTESIDTAQPDVPSDPCIGASLGGACDEGSNGATCNYVCGGTCGECSGLYCDGRSWTEIRDAPPVECDNRCPPSINGNDESPCGPDLACQYTESIEDFVCDTPGFGVLEQECEASTDCEAGSSCLRCQSGNCDTSNSRCYRHCDPDGANADGFCGGSCERMSDHGYPFDDVGFCIFLGG